MATHYGCAPIPPCPEGVNARSYHSVRVNLIASEAREPLVDLRDFGIAGECYYCRKDGLNAPYYRALAGGFGKLLVRSGVVTRLQRVNEMLRSWGLEIYVWDAFRPIACQRELWAYFMEEAKLHEPGGNEEVWGNWCSRYCSDPSRYDLNDFRTWPTHTTGGAVDVTLRRISSGELLYMGGIFDDPSGVSHSAHFEVMPKAELTQSDLNARANRRMLYWTMSGAEFSNYPREWWHYDYGTQMWVTNWPNADGSTPPKEAFYGSVEP